MGLLYVSVEFTVLFCACVCILYFVIYSCRVGRQGPFLDLITCTRSVEEFTNFPHIRAPVGSKYSLRFHQEKRIMQVKREKAV